jgi:beta-lactamase class A
MTRTNFRGLLLFVFLFCLVVACSKDPTVQQAQTKSKTPATLCSLDKLRSRIEELARTAGGPVGVAISLTENGQLISVNGQQHFPMQSVYKLPIGMAVLHQVDQGKLNLEQKVSVKPAEFVRVGMHSRIRDNNPRGVELPLRDLLTYAVSESDGTASDVLLRVLGGAEVVRDYLRTLGVDGMMVLDTEKEIGKSPDIQYRNWATPESALALLKVVADGRSLTPDSQKILLQLLTETPTGPKRIKGLLPPGTVVAHKTGTGATEGIVRALNDIGVVTLPDGRKLAIAVFISDTKLDHDACEAVIAKISRAAWDCWAESGPSSSPH